MKSSEAAIDRIFAVLPVADIAAAERWYQKLFGRPADAIPMPSLREWHEGSAGFQVLEAPDRAGRTYATVMVRSIDDTRATLAARGLVLGPTQKGDVAGIAQIDDPDGNTLTFAQRGPKAPAERGDNEAIVRAAVEAYRDRRRADNEALIAADFTFTSPMDDAISRDEFYKRCWPPGDDFARMDIERITGDADGAFLTYLITMKKDGAQFRNTEYFGIRDGQIRSVTVYFGATYRGGHFVPKKPSGD